MGTAAILLVCCALAGAAAGQSVNCTVDAAGTRGDCRPITRCPTLLTRAKMVSTAQNRSAEINFLRQLVKKCPRKKAGGVQICCQNEVTRTAPPPPKLRLPTKPHCGQTFVDRVIAGENATIGEFPWMVSILWSINDGLPLVHGCGASLITSRHVLTAAHCVTGISKPGRKVEVRAVVLGELDFDSHRDCEGKICADPAVTVDVDRIFFHPEFQNIMEAGLPNDIAVLKLTREVAFTKYIKPVCLMTDLSVLSNGKSDDTPGLRGVVTGWGRSKIGSEITFTTVLQKAIVPMQSIKKCERKYRPNVSLPRRLCAGRGVNNADTCRGDSGGPLMVPVEFAEFWYQTGVSSFGTKDCGHVSGYTRVFDYKDWIVDQINK